MIARVAGAPYAGYGFTAARDGSFLLVSDGGILRFSPASGTSVGVVGDSGWRNWDAAPSPNGLKLVHLRSDWDSEELVVRDGFGGDPTILVDTTQVTQAQRPAWLDNDTIVFLGVGSTDDEWRLWSVRSDGTELGYFASDTGLMVHGAYPAPSGDVLMVVWRPTGGLPDEYWILDRAGTLVRRVVAFGGGVYPGIAWSPDSRFVAICVLTEFSTGDLMLVEVASGAVRQLTFAEGKECYPAWVP